MAIKKTMNALHEAPALLTPELIARESELTPDLALGLSQAWTEAARALDEPSREGPIESRSDLALQTALQVFGKVMGDAAPGGTTMLDEDALAGFPHRVRAAEGSARAMGFSADQTDALWGVAFNLRLAEFEDLSAQRRVCAKVAIVSERFDFSESVAWALMERSLIGSLKVVCDEENGAGRLPREAGECRKSLERIVAMAQRSQRPRRWLGEREARVIKAMGSVARLTAEAGMDEKQSAPEVKRSVERIQAGEAALLGMLRASEEAERARAQPEMGANVKRRSVGAS